MARIWNAVKTSIPPIIMGSAVIGVPAGGWAIFIPIMASGMYQANVSAM